MYIPPLSNMYDFIQARKKKSAAAECTRENLLGNGTLLMIGRQLIHAVQW
jgi:hypothetical protein